MQQPVASMGIKPSDPRIEIRVAVQQLNAFSKTLCRTEGTLEDITKSLVMIRLKTSPSC